MADFDGSRHFFPNAELIAESQVPADSRKRIPASENPLLPASKLLIYIKNCLDVYQRQP